MTYKLSEVMPPAFFELHRRIRAGEVTEALGEKLVYLRRN